MAVSMNALLRSDRDNDLNFFNFSLALPTEMDAIEAAKRLNLLPERAKCPPCPINGNSVELRICKDVEGSQLGFRWVCVVCRAQGHPYRFSPTQNTFFNRSHIKLRTTFRLTYCWFEKMKVTDAAFHCQVTEETAINMYRELRSICLTVVTHDAKQLGGNGDVVELDETHLFTRKYHRGRLYRRQFWVFGGRSRLTGSCFISLIPDKSKDTLWPILQQNVAVDSFIMTDQHRSYFGCEGLGFKGHAFVNHSRNYVRPDRELIRDVHPHIKGGDVGAGPTPGFRSKYVKVHTNSLERLWRELKKAVRTVEQVGMLPSYIGEFQYRHNVLKNLPTKSQKLQQLFEDIRRVYPGINGGEISMDTLRCSCNICSAI